MEAFAGPSFTTIIVSRIDFELGGRAGNTVTTSDNMRILKGWKLVQIDDQDISHLQGDAVTAALAAARKRGKFKATFSGGKLTGGGGMLQIKAVAKLATRAKAEPQADNGAAAAHEQAVAAERAAAERAAAENAAAERAAKEAAAKESTANAASAAEAKAAAEAAS